MSLASARSKLQRNMKHSRGDHVSTPAQLPGLILAVAVLVSLMGVAAARAQESPRPLLLHVKTALSVDDAQICVVPNVAWASATLMASLLGLLPGVAGAAAETVRKSYDVKGFT